jgi:hypothetical protein
MIYRQFGNTGINVSSVGLGTWNIGNHWGEINENTAFSVIQTSQALANVRAGDWRFSPEEPAAFKSL